MAEFSLSGRQDKDVIIRFLSSISADRLSKMVLERSDWGGKSPMHDAIECLKEMAEQWG